MRQVHHYPHFADEKTEAQKLNNETNHTTKFKVSWALNSGNLFPESKYLIKCNSTFHTAMLFYSF